MSLTNSVMFILGLSLMVLGANGNAASIIDPCHINDNACILASSQKVLPLIVKGNKELGIASSDPMHFDHVAGNAGELELSFDDLTVVGASQCKLLKVERPEKYTIILAVECPISAIGKYNVKGKLINLSVHGNDDFEFKTDKIRIDVKLTLKSHDGKDGQEYYKISKFDFTYDPIGEVKLTFKNLHAGSEENDAAIYKLIEQSPKELLSTLGNAVVKEIITKIVEVVGHVFNVIPASQIEIRDD